MNYRKAKRPRVPDGPQMTYIPLDAAIKSGLYVPPNLYESAKQLTDTPVFIDETLMPDAWYVAPGPTLTDDDIKQLRQILGEALREAGAS